MPDLGLIPRKGAMLVRQLAAEREVRGGIEVVEQAGVPLRGEVQAVTGIQGVAVGDVVLFGAYSGELVEHEGESLVALKAGDVIAVVR